MDRSVPLCALLAAFAATPSSALSQSDATFVAPAECGSAEAFAARVALTRGPADTVPVDTQVEIARDADGYTLALRSAGGARLLHDPDCGALFDAAALIVALGDAATPLAEAQAGDTSAAPSAAPSDTTSGSLVARASGSLPARHDAVPSRPAPPVRLGARGALYVGLTSGLVPGVSGSFGASAALTRGNWAVRLGGQYLTVREGSNGILAVRVDALAPALDLSWRLLPRFALELGGDLVALRGRGVSGLSERTDWALELAAHLGVTSALYLDPRRSVDAFLRGYAIPAPASFDATDMRLLQGGHIAAVAGLSVSGTIL